MKEFQLKIDKEVWTMRLFPQDEYELIIASDSEAETDTNLKCICFLQERITRTVIEHEITHVYFDKLCLRSCDSFDLRQMEEILAEFIPRYSRDIIKTSKKLQKEIDKQLKE